MCKLGWQKGGVVGNKCIIKDSGKHIHRDPQLHVVVVSVEWGTK